MRRFLGFLYCFFSVLLILDCILILKMMTNVSNLFKCSFPPGLEPKINDVAFIYVI